MPDKKVSISTIQDTCYVPTTDYIDVTNDTGTIILTRQDIIDLYKTYQ